MLQNTSSQLVANHNVVALPRIRCLAYGGEPIRSSLLMTNAVHGKNRKKKRLQGTATPEHHKATYTYPNQWNKQLRNALETEMTDDHLRLGWKY